MTLPLQSESEAQRYGEGNAWGTRIFPAPCTNLMKPIMTTIHNIIHTISLVRKLGSESLYDLLKGVQEGTETRFACKPYCL